MCFIFRKNTSKALNCCFSYSIINFAVAGDFGCEREAKKTIDVIKSKDPELVIALGDLAYKKNPQCWFDLISPIDKNNKFKISLGEHDA
jgi:hypothetical protein